MPAFARCSMYQSQYYPLDRLYSVLYTPCMKRPLTAQESTDRAALWLYRGNRAAERGDHELAERHYEKAQKYHDAMNVALGNGDGHTPVPLAPED